MITISWNIRGLGTRIKRSALRKLILTHDPIFVFVQETKMEQVTEKITRSCSKSEDFNWIFSPSVGTSGGLLSMWNKIQFQMSKSVLNRHWIAIEGKFPSLNFECILVNIYNPCSVKARLDVWEEISDYCKLAYLPCLIIGDFNEVLKASERGSNLSSQTGIDHFRNFLQEMHLMEIAPSSKSFTWFRGNSKSSLDRLFVTSEWLSIFPSLSVTLLQRGLSDHCPLLVLSKPNNWGPKPFRFQNVWLTDSKCLKIIQETWAKSSSSLVADKLKDVKKTLKQWNRDDFGNIDMNIVKLGDLIQKYDDIANQRELTTEELEERQKSHTDLWMWMKRRELYWAQNSRISWLKDGDRNTKFFHVIASNRRRKNTIQSIDVNGATIDDPGRIKNEAVSFFKGIFKEECFNRPTFEGLDFNKLSQAQAAALIEPFSNDEIDNAVSSCDSDKAPGPDGFNFRFVKEAWATIKQDVYAIVREFHTTAQLPRGCNTAFIALIPKIDSPKEFKDYRPISMVGCIYKIISKVMAKRLQKVMSSLVGPLQSSYIEGRKILDGALIASELIDSCKRRKIESTLFKLDFHKAYDSVSYGLFLNGSSNK